MNETVDDRRVAPAGWIRGGLGLISLGTLSVGVWALFLPRSFYEDFPFSGREWVSALGPYNEHLVRDVGALNLSLGVLLALAAVLLDRRLVQASLLAYLVYTVPHFIFHLTHTHAFSVGDNLANLILLALLVLLPAVILASPTSRSKRHHEENATQALEPFVRQWAVLLTTYKRDGTPVGTAVNIVVEGDHAYFRTWDTAWKFRRIRNNPGVEFAPSTALGRPTGPEVRARARVLEGKESARAGRLLARKYPVSHGILVPLAHRLRGNRTVHVELTPVAGDHA